MGPRANCLALKHRESRIAPVLFEDCPAPLFDLVLGNLQHADFRPGQDREKARKRLLACWGIKPVDKTPDKKIVNSLGMTLVRIEPGTFTMGSDRA